MSNKITSKAAQTHAFAALPQCLSVSVLRAVWHDTYLYLTGRLKYCTAVAFRKVCVRKAGCVRKVKNHDFNLADKTVHFPYLYCINIYMTVLCICDYTYTIKIMFKKKVNNNFSWISEHVNKSSGFCLCYTLKTVVGPFICRCVCVSWGSVILSRCDSSPMCFYVYDVKVRALLCNESPHTICSPSVCLCSHPLGIFYNNPPQPHTHSNLLWLNMIFRCTCAPAVLNLNPIGFIPKRN